MTTALVSESAPIATRKSSARVLLGDEAVARAALDAGITAAYAYPGTPATEIQEFLLRHAEAHGRPAVSWCANEKTAYEQALGVSLAGRRALVSMKHVGLNVAADPFINSAIVSIHGGLVLAVADDPGMHSSQNEQDSRFYADFARVICLEPADQQQAYDMTREAFGLSERFHIPVMIRLVTRLAHSRAVIHTRPSDSEPPVRKVSDARSWILLPSIARRQWRALLDRQREVQEYASGAPHNSLTLEPMLNFGVITSGVARNYYLETVGKIRPRPSHLHIGAYPLPVDKIRKLAAEARTLFVLEEGFPFIERLISGMLPAPLEVRGRLSGHLPPDGELTPDTVRVALGIPLRGSVEHQPFELPARPPQLCPGCPHRDAYKALRAALDGQANSIVTSDIGCYTLGALPPYNAIESCVCMGASIGMAKGAAQAGLHPVVAVIGDSTFLHSGVTPLLDAVTADANMTLVILDNDVVAMTGGQPTILPAARLHQLVLGLGVPPGHCHLIEAHPRTVGEMTALLRREFDHRGLSVVIAARECIETARKRKKETPQAEVSR
jgi:indolepyruvate ferredoxin oxidoreductase alpha subunit